MHTERPISKEEADAFEDAVAALDNWIGEDKEPEVLFRGGRWTIGTVCNFAALFSDPMPEGVYGLLNALALEHYVEPPDDDSYASGAKCLRAVHNKYTNRREARRQWERSGHD